MGCLTEKNRQKLGKKYDCEELVHSDDRKDIGENLSRSRGYEYDEVGEAKRGCIGMLTSFLILHFNELTIYGNDYFFFFCEHRCVGTQPVNLMTL